MFASTALAFSLVAPLALAAVHDITVGSPSGQTIYTPNAISAEVGDQVVFHFEQKNHTVTQSSFAAPCTQKDGGFNSGFMPVAANVTSDFPTFTITVNDTNPIWVFCDQNAGLPTSHCGMGMVFAVNCGADGSPTSFTSFMNSALAIGQSLQMNTSSSSSSNSTSSSGSSYGAPPSSSTTEPPATNVSSTTTTTAAGTTHTVTVGANGALEFSPSQFAAAVGDVVLFEFMAKNHTATQSTFAAPCEKEQFTTSTVGFDSGFMPVAANTSGFPTFSITVNDTTPIWVYCRQTNPVDHCGSGMVLGINSNETTGSTKTFADFKALAMQINGTSNGTSSSNSSSSGNSSSTDPSSAASGASPRYTVALPATLALVGAFFALL